MKSKILIVLFMLILNSCSQEYEFWEISKFNLEEDALIDNEEIQLIYSSRGPYKNKKIKFYTHLIVVSIRTGDTVNILTPVLNSFSDIENNGIYNFINKDNSVFKMAQLNSDEAKEIKHVDEINNFKNDKIKIVARDPNFDYIADNSYPTIIGMIGIVTYTK